MGGDERQVGGEVAAGRRRGGSGGQADEGGEQQRGAAEPAPEADGVGQREHRWLLGFAVGPDTVSDARNRRAGRRRDPGRSWSCPGRAPRVPAWYLGSSRMVPGEDARQMTGSLASGSVSRQSSARRLLPGWHLVDVVVTVPFVVIGQLDVWRPAKPCSHP